MFIISSNIRKYITFRNILLVALAVHLPLMTLLSASPYLEGLGTLSFGSGFFLWFASLLMGLIVLVLLIALACCERKNCSISITFSKIGGAVLLFISANFLWLFLSGPGYIGFTKGFLERVDRSCTEQEVRIWASEFIVRNRDEQRGHRFTDPNGNPEFIKRIHPFSSNHDAPFNWLITDTDEMEILSVYWGGALAGYWGLEIGPPDFELTNRSSIYALQWRRGIYVWKTTE